MKVGIVGAGGMAGYHYDGFVRAGAEVVAMADTDLKRAEAFGKSRGITRFYPSLTEMIAGEPGLDAVSIITPNKFHKPLVIEALNKGKHVYCEKPPALNASEMAEMAEAAKKSGKHLIFDLNNRARPESQAMIRFIREGIVGKINSAQAYWIRRTGIPGFGSWFTNKAVSGGGALLDLPHMLDLAMYFMGYPEPDQVLGSVFYDFMDNRYYKGPWGMPDVAGGVTDVESSIHAMVTFKTGQCLMVRSSWAEMNEREIVSVTFQGQKAGGMVERLFERDGLDDTSIDRCLLFREEFGHQTDLKVKIEKDESMGRINMAVNFIEAIEGKAAPYNTPHEALILMKVIDGIYASAETKQAVKIT
ncbi:oxidoreductase [Spirochaetia bacterium]|nr:oxidoreductase [Spirochaetia bacterium]